MEEKGRNTISPFYFLELPLLPVPIFLGFPEDLFILFLLSLFYTFLQLSLDYFFNTITHCGYQCAFLAFIHHIKIRLFAVSSAQANIIKRPNNSLAASELLEPVITPSKTQSEVGGRGD